MFERELEERKQKERRSAQTSINERDRSGTDLSLYDGKSWNRAGRLRRPTMSGTDWAPTSHCTMVSHRRSAGQPRRPSRSGTDWAPTSHYTMVGHRRSAGRPRPPSRSGTDWAPTSHYTMVSHRTGQVGPDLYQRAEPIGHGRLTVR